MNPRADIGLEAAHIGEVVLQGQGRRENPCVGDLAESGDGSLAVDFVLGEATEKLDREIVVEKVGQGKGRDNFGADIGVSSGDHGAARAHRRLAVRIDHGAESAHHEVPIVASGHGGNRPADHGKPQPDHGHRASRRTSHPLSPSLRKSSRILGMLRASIKRRPDPVSD